MSKLMVLVAVVVGEFLVRTWEDVLMRAFGQQVLQQLGQQRRFENVYCRLTIMSLPIEFYDRCLCGSCSYWISRPADCGRY